MTFPTATYRLQFRNGMTFDRAIDLVPRLNRLGVSHLYCSPIFTAAAGSTHGYDIANPNEIDPELGGRDGFDRLANALRAANIGVILDIVPNHLAASLDNAWWRSVVEWGAESPYARHFDIDWSQRLTLPILSTPLEEAIRLDETHLAFDSDRGMLAFSVHGSAYPLNPRSYAAALSGFSEPGLRGCLKKRWVISRGYDSFGFARFDGVHNGLERNHPSALCPANRTLRKRYDRPRMGTG